MVGDLRVLAGRAWQKGLFAMCFSLHMKRNARSPDSCNCPKFLGGCRSLLFFRSQLWINRNQCPAPGLHVCPLCLDVFLHLGDFGLGERFTVFKRVHGFLDLWKDLLSHCSSVLSFSFPATT